MTTMRSFCSLLLLTVLIFSSSLSAQENQIDLLDTYKGKALQCSVTNSQDVSIYVQEDDSLDWVALKTLFRKTVRRVKKRKGSERARRLRKRLNRKQQNLIKECRKILEKQEAPIDEEQEPPLDEEDKDGEMPQDGTPPGEETNTPTPTPTHSPTATPTPNPTPEDPLEFFTGDFRAAVSPLVELCVSPFGSHTVEVYLRELPRLESDPVDPFVQRFFVHVQRIGGGFIIKQEGLGTYDPIEDSLRFELIDISGGRNEKNLYVRRIASKQVKIQWNWRLWLGATRSCIDSYEGEGEKFSQPQ